MKNGFGNGWDHLGTSRFLLVLRSVSNVTAHPVLVDERSSLWMEVDRNDLFEPTTGVTSD